MNARALRSLLLSFGAILLLSSCAKKKAIPVGEFESYQDPIYGFGISYPTEWVKDPEVGRRFRAYSSFDARDRFLDPTGPKQAGVMLEVGIDTTRGMSLESYVDNVRDQYGTMFTFEQPQAMTLDGNHALKLGYSMKVDARNFIRGYRIASVKDNLLTYVDVEGFNDLLEDYKGIFDTALTTVRFGRPLTVKGKEDISKPAETFDKYTGKLFDIAYPTNFDIKFPQKPNVDLVMELKGYRQDCTVRIEVSDAKNLTVEKVTEQNRVNLQKAGYRIKRTAIATIDGNRATLIDLTYAKGEVDSRAYFTVKENKMYYIFLTWFRPQANVYVPTFEKMVSSMKIK
jgi:hypothetical protein